MKFSLAALAIAIPSSLACVTFSGYAFNGKIGSAYLIDNGQDVCDSAYGVGDAGGSWLITCQSGYGLEFHKDGHWVGYDTPHGRYTWNQAVSGSGDNYSWNVRQFC